MAKSLQGIVTSTKGNKTIVVAVENRKTHPVYKKQYAVTRKILAHDEKNSSQVGDEVLINETRPRSRHKHFTLDKILKTAVISEADRIENIAAAETPVKPKEEPKATIQPETKTEEKK
jgi:small subunit ribosomal protein S17